MIRTVTPASITWHRDYPSRSVACAVCGDRGPKRIRPEARRIVR